MEVLFNVYFEIIYISLSSVELLFDASYVFFYVGVRIIHELNYFKLNHKIGQQPMK